MKKINLLFALILLVFASKAQTRLGLRAGLNFANMSPKIGAAFGSDVKVGFHIGGAVNVGLGDKMFFQPTLLLSSKGSKSSSFIGTATINPLYLELPLNLLYKITDIEGVGVNFLLGPYVAAGIGGNIKHKSGGGSITEPIKWGQHNTDDIRPIDYGINIGAGIEYNNIQLNLQYGIGIANIDPRGNTNSSYVYRNSTFALALGYFFGGK